MKKTLTINLNNIVFHIDDDAYELLNKYLSDVERHLSEDEKREVMADIEARIAELFNERLQRNKNVITIDDINEIIGILGSPNQYSDGDAESETSNTENTKSDKKKAKRFYRDAENGILGGVGSGIAAYFSWDVTWVRVFLILLTFITGFNLIWIYLLVWIIAPRATTASQRLEMQGEDVTVENIKEEVKNIKNYVESDKFKHNVTTFGDRFVIFMRKLFKVLFGVLGSLIGFIGIIILGVLIIGLLAFIFNPGVVNGFYPDIISNWEILTPEKITLFVISVLLVVGCPVFMLVYWIIRVLSGRHDYSHTTSIIVLILWLAGLFMFYSVGAQTIINWKKWDSEFSSDIKNHDSPRTEEFRTLDDFNEIEISGNIKVILTQDSVQQIKIDAPENLMKRVFTEVIGGKLHIYTKNTIFFDREIKAYISQDSLRMIEVTGASSIKTDHPFYTSEMKLDFSGASQADLKLFVTGKTEIDLSGASSINLEGKTKEGNVDVSGASKLDAEDFKSEVMIVKVTGASKAKVYASLAIAANASGASEIVCFGNPVNVKKSDHLSSSVIIK